MKGGAMRAIFNVEAQAQRFDAGSAKLFAPCSVAPWGRGFDSQLS